MNHYQIGSKLTRGTFLKTAAAGTTALMAVSMFPGCGTRKAIALGVQLYSLRNTMPSDVAGHLAGIKAIGYEGIEFAGYYDLEAKALRQMLDDNGLECFGSHLQLNVLLGDRFEETVEVNQILGNKRLVVASMGGGVDTIDAWKQMAETFNGIAEKVRPLGMTVGFHNHTIEFTPIDGQVPLDLFYNQTHKEVFLQLDTGHAVHAGVDPVAYIEKFPGRIPSIHAKEWTESNPAALIGEGDVNWPQVLHACETVGGTEVYIVEEESDAYPGLEGIDLSLQNLKKFINA